MIIHLKNYHFVTSCIYMFLVKSLPEYVLMEGGWGFTSFGNTRILKARLVAQSYYLSTTLPVERVGRSSKVGNLALERHLPSLRKPSFRSSSLFLLGSGLDRHGYYEAHCIDRHERHLPSLKKSFVTLPQIAIIVIIMRIIDRHIVIVLCDQILNILLFIWILDFPTNQICGDG